MMYDEEMGPLGKKLKNSKKTLIAAQKWLC